MKTQIVLILFIFVISPIGCTINEDADTNNNNSDSFYPMSIGNYWKINDDNYTKIVDTIRIGGNLYYKFYSLIGGDGIAIEYLQIDAKNDLIGGSPSNPKFTSIHAQFNSSVGDTFYRLSDKSVNDYQIVVTFKNNDTIKFEWDMIYHPTVKGQKFIKAYKKGFGLIGNWKEACINNGVITLK